MTEDLANRVPELPRVLESSRKVGRWSGPQARSGCRSGDRRGSCMLITHNARIGEMLSVVNMRVLPRVTFDRRYVHLCGPDGRSR